MLDSGPEAVVQRQVEAYNAGDLDRFCACYSEDVTVLDAEGAEVASGMLALRDLYRRIFLEGHSSEVVSRLVLGSEVVDHKVVHTSARRLEGLVAYRMAGDRIDRVEMLGRVARVVLTPAARQEGGPAASSVTSPMCAYGRSPSPVFAHWLTSALFNWIRSTSFLAPIMLGSRPFFARCTACRRELASSSQMYARGTRSSS